MDKNRFYVYAFLDPRKPKATYGIYDFDHEPFYIGKGEGRRIHTHVGKKLKANTPKNNKIKKLFSINLDPIKVFIKTRITEKEAFNLEIKIIKTIGRKDLGTGCLNNLTEGGEGLSGFKHSKSTKNKIRNSLIGVNVGRFVNDSWREKISKNHSKYWTGKHLSETSIQKMKKTKKDNPQDRSYQYKKYVVINPNGKKYTITNGLQSFCDNHNLTRSCLLGVANKTRKHHKGWKCFKTD
jgi:hypothetical protein